MVCCGTLEEAQPMKRRNVFRVFHLQSLFISMIITVPFTQMGCTRLYVEWNNGKCWLELKDMDLRIKTSKSCSL